MLLGDRHISWIKVGEWMDLYGLWQTNAKCKKKARADMSLIETKLNIMDFNISICFKNDSLQNIVSPLHEP